MNKLVCEICGGSIIKQEDGFVCQDCGCKYSLNAVRKILNDHEQLSPGTLKETAGDNKAEELISKARNIVSIYIDKGSERDVNGYPIKISEEKYQKAKAYLDQAAELDASNWEIWFVKGMLAEIQTFDDTDPSDVQEFERAIERADENAIKNRIFPHILKEALKSVQFCLEYKFGEPSLESYRQFFEKYGDKAKESKRTFDEAWSKYCQIKKDRYQKRKVLVDAIIARMNELRQRYAEAISSSELRESELKNELKQKREEIEGIESQISRCGLFDGKKKRAFEEQLAKANKQESDIENEVRVQKKIIDDELAQISAEAYVLCNNNIQSFFPIDKGEWARAFDRMVRNNEESLGITLGFNESDYDVDYVYEQSINENTLNENEESWSNVASEMQRDIFFDEAADLVRSKGKVSIGMLQRNFGIGFNRAARILDQLEEAGIVGPEEGTKPRKVYY